MESLGRLREPATYIVFGALCLEVAAAVAGLILLSRNGGYGSTADVALSLGSQFPHALTVVALALLAASCLLGERTRHAGMLGLLAIIAGGIAVLQQLAFALFGLTASGTGKSTSLIATVLSLVVPSVALIGLGMLLRAQSRVNASSPATTVIEQRPTTEKPAAIAGPAHPPSWQPETATGVAWHTAGEAAAGAPGAGWGSGESGGWQPIPGGDSSGRQGERTLREGDLPDLRPLPQPNDPWRFDWTSRPGGSEPEPK